ncbi:MAG: ACP S-malonyltransferase [Candidatus Omnitrophica bacterium]|nr:ACP S-malonyltransferase [Candidatus Omnitrophota bacterium]
METTAFVFPGQGAQYVGMGKSVYSAFSPAKKIFDQADQILGFSISKLCFDGPEEILTDTANAQVGIFVTSMAILSAIQSLRPDFTASVVCGLSLGEFTALVACGALQFEDGVRLVRKRGELMARATKENPGTMASILGLTLENCVAVENQAGAQIANINAPGQIVMSGTQEAVLRSCEVAKEKGGKAIPLKVSGAFHSKLMRSAQESLGQTLQRTQIQKPKTAFIPNVTGKVEQDPEKIKALLGRQVTQSVQWVKTMETLGALGVRQAFEIGPGKVLKGLAKRNNVGFSVSAIETEADILELIKTMEEKAC